jgi:hypothetical protein
MKDPCIDCKPESQWPGCRRICPLEEGEQVTGDIIGVNLRREKYI